jgi:hypothetical protein
MRYLRILNHKPKIINPDPYRPLYMATAFLKFFPELKIKGILVPRLTTLATLYPFLGSSKMFFLVAFAKIANARPEKNEV